MLTSSASCSPPTELPLDNVRVVLNGGMYTAIPRQDGSFKLHAVAPGSYLLEVLDTQSVWPTVRLDVSATSGKARAYAATSSGSSRAGSTTDTSSTRRPLHWIVSRRSLFTCGFVCSGTQTASSGTEGSPGV
jgi:hypothetical protein